MTDSGLDRREVMKRLVKDRGGLLVVSGLGGTSWDATAAGDSDLNFVLWGGMGNAAMIGLGLALARPERRVLVVTGDGEILMGLGGLATIAVQRPANLAVVVLDNELYGETGRQATHTAAGVDLAAIARGAGIAVSSTLTALDEVDALRARLHHGPGPIFAVVKIAKTQAPMVLPPRDGPLLKQRFREALLGPGAA